MLRQKYSKKKRREKFKNKTKKKYSGGGPEVRTRPNTGRRARAQRKRDEAVMKQNEDMLERLNREAGIATSRQNEEAMQKLLEDSVPESCSARAKRHPICKTCGWTKDPAALKKCKCCPSSPQETPGARGKRPTQSSFGATSSPPQCRLQSEQ